MFSRCHRVCPIFVLAFAASAFAEGRVLRVCADPNNLPFSNQAGEGFENRIAELLAHRSRRTARIYLVATAKVFPETIARCASLRPGDRDACGFG